jgi:hypothetical protein
MCMLRYVQGASNRRSCLQYTCWCSFMRCVVCYSFELHHAVLFYWCVKTIVFKPHWNWYHMSYWEILWSFRTSITLKKGDNHLCLTKEKYAKCLSEVKAAKILSNKQSIHHRWLKRFDVWVTKFIPFSVFCLYIFVLCSFWTFSTVKKNFLTFTVFSWNMRFYQ